MATSFPDVARARINTLQDADDKHAEELRTAKNDLYNSAINDPNLDVLDPNDPDKDKKIATRNALIQERLQNMSPAEAHNAIGDLINTIHSHIANRNNPAPAPAAPASSGAPPPPAVAGSNLPPPPPPVVPGPTGAAPAASSASSLNLGAPPAPQPTFEAPIHPFQKLDPNHPLSTGAKDIDTLAQSVAPHYISPTGQQMMVADANQQRKINLKAAPSGSARPVVVKDSKVSLDDARKLTEAGHVFNDENGEPIDLDSYADTKTPLALTALRQGSKTFYMVGDQRLRPEIVNNHVFMVPEIGTTTAADENPNTDLGVKNVGATSTHQAPGALPGEKVTLTSTRTPNTLPVAAVPARQPVLLNRDGTVATPPGQQTTEVAPVAPETPVNAPAMAALNAPSASKGRPVPASRNAPPMPGVSAKPAVSPSKPVPVSKFAPQVPGVVPAPLTPGSDSDFSSPPATLMHGMTLSQGKPAMATVAKIGPLQAQLFGESGAPPLWKFADLFDSPKTAAAINLALTLNTAPIPGVDDHSTELSSTLARTLGLTKWAQMSTYEQAKSAREAVAQAGPRAQELLNRLSELKGSVSSIRTATGAPATESAAQTMIQEAPIYNINGSDDFRSRTANLANTVVGALKNTQGINPGYTEWWAKGSRQARGYKAPVSANAPVIPDVQPARPSNVPEGYVHQTFGGKGYWVPPQGGSKPARPANVPEGYVHVVTSDGQSGWANPATPQNRSVPRSSRAAAMPQD